MSKRVYCYRGYHHYIKPNQWCEIKSESNEIIWVKLKDDNKYHIDSLPPVHIYKKDFHLYFYTESEYIRINNLNQLLGE